MAVRSTTVRQKGVVVKELAGTGGRSTWTPAMQRNVTHAQKLKAVQGTAVIAEKYQVAEDKLEATLKGRLCAGGRREDTPVLLEGELAAPTAQVLSLLTMVSTAATKSYRVVTLGTGQALPSAKTESEVYVRLGKRLADLLV